MAKCRYFPVDRTHIQIKGNPYLFSDGIDGKELPLLFECFALCKAAHGLALPLNVVHKLLVRLVVCGAILQLLGVLCAWGWREGGREGERGGGMEKEEGGREGGREEGGGEEKEGEKVSREEETWILLHQSTNNFYSLLPPLRP